MTASASLHETTRPGCSSRRQKRRRKRQRQQRGLLQKTTIHRHTHHHSCTSTTALVQNPLHLLEELIFGERRVAHSDVTSSVSSVVSPLPPIATTGPTRTMIEAYTMQVLTIARRGDLAALKRLYYEQHIPLDCSNRFGESLLHFLCRRGKYEMVKFLIDVVQSNITIVDDFNRNILHYACWTARPNFVLMDYLYQRLPIAYWLAKDVRGHTPLDYIRPEHWKVWCDFVRSHAAVSSVSQGIIPITRKPPH